MRCHNTAMRILSLAAILCFPLAARAPLPQRGSDASPGPSGSSSLHLVKRIHIGALEGDGPERTLLLQRNLRTELHTAGFEIVDQSPAADAVLSAKIEIWIVLDGDERDQLDNRYRFQLTLPTTGIVLWKAKVLASHGQRAEDEALGAARQASRKLTASWRKSARKAGINVFPIGLTRPRQRQ